MTRPPARAASRRVAATGAVSPFHPALLLLYAGAAFLLLWNLGSGSLENSDGPLYATYARQQLASGNWLDMEWFGHAEILKPPGFIWLLDLSVLAAGDGELGFRLPAATSSLLLVLVVTACARRLTDRHALACALVAGGALLASGLLYYNARKVQAELPLALATTLSLYALLRVKDSPRFLWLWGAALGAGALLKGVMVLPVLGAGLVVLWLLRRRALLSRHGAVGLGLFAALAVPWHVIQAARSPGFLGHYFATSLGGRLVRSLPGSGGDDPLRYVRALWAFDHLLAPLLLGAGVVTAWLALRAARTHQRERAEGLTLVALYWIFLAVAIQLARTRLPYYVVPLLPLWALGLGYIVTRIPRLRWIHGAGITLLLCALFVTNNLATLRDLDRSPGIKRLARLAARRTERLYTYNLYHTAAAFYARRRVDLLTDDRAAYHKLVAWPVFSRSGTIRLLSPGELATVLSRPGTGVLTTRPFAARLASLLGPPARATRHRDVVLFVVR